MEQFYYLITASVLTGITCALLLCIGKHIAIVYQKPKIDRLITLVRYTIFLFFLLIILQLKTTSPILFIGLFLLSYLGTVILCIKKTG